MEAGPDPQRLPCGPRKGQVERSTSVRGPEQGAHRQSHGARCLEGHHDSWLSCESAIDLAPMILQSVAGWSYGRAAHRKGSHGPDAIWRSARREP